MFIKQYGSVFELVDTLGEQLGSVDSTIDELFPHIAKKILFLWGSPECVQYLDELIHFRPTSDRPTRQGFPLQAILELDIILKAHHKEFPQYKQADDIWAGR